MGFKVWAYHLSTKAVLPQYYPFGRSKYIPAQTTKRQQKDNLNYIIIYNTVFIKNTNENQTGLTIMIRIGRKRGGVFYVVVYVVSRFLKDESTSFAARTPVSNAPCKQGFTDVFVASPQKNKVFDHSGFAKSARVLAVHPTLGGVYEPPANLSSVKPSPSRPAYQLADGTSPGGMPAK